MAKCSRSNTHLLSTESPAFDKVLISVEHRTGMGLGWASRFSRRVLSASACSLESAGAARAADRALKGSKGAPAMLLDVTPPQHRRLGARLSSLLAKRVFAYFDLLWHRTANTAVVYDKAKNKVKLREDDLDVSHSAHTSAALSRRSLNPP